MAKGVKKIKWTGKGKVIANKSIPNKKVTIDADQIVSFEVESWYNQTTEEEKKKNITWILQDREKQTIIIQKVQSANLPKEISIPKELCGPFQYYLEASLGGKRDFHNETGLYISGYAPAKLISSKWSQVYDGKDIRKTYFFSYGEKVYLNLKTEGLNGHQNLQILIFRHLNFQTDPAVFKYTDVLVIDGEINLEITSSFNWYTAIKDIKQTEEFYIKIYDPIAKVYITDEKGLTDHATFLRINKKIVSKEIKPPTNLSPLKTGEPDKNEARFELCRFETISITENKNKKTVVFDNGENLIKVWNPKTPILKTILFDFDKSDINSDAKTVLNNVLQYLLGSRHSTIKIDGHACVIGKEKYNQKLSQERSDAVKKIFVHGGLDASRIISIGRGEVNPTDDKKGRDNIKYKDEKKYIENRRVDIMFDSFGHDAQTIIYETIAPSHNQNLTIDVTEYQNKACFKENLKHQKNVKVNSPEYSKPINQVTNKLDFPVKSNLSQFNLFPIKYIYPKVFSNEYSIDIHSCRYFSNDANHTVKVIAYPDIKWHFHFFLNLSNKLSVKWQKLPPGKHKEMQSKAGKIGAEKRWKQTEIEFGFMLEADWDKNGEGKYGEHFDASGKYEKKIKQLYSLFSALKEFSKTITDHTKGKVSKTRLGKDLSFEIYMDPPNFFIDAVWSLARGEKKGKETLEIGTAIELNFKAEPLIALALNIDLLGGLVQLGVAALTAGSFNTVALRIYNEVQEWLGDENHSITIKMYIDLEITSTINGASKLELNTASDKSKGDAELEAVLKVELKAGVEIKANVVIIIGEAYAIAEVSGKAVGSVTFGHKLLFDKNSETTSVYYQPKLNFDGLRVTGVIKAKIGLLIKKGIFKGDHDKELVDYKYDGNLFEPFDVIQKIAKTAKIDSKIQLI
jgi:outer membrane protein OmpA-like peptidoglycan-associated protein